MTKLMEWLFFFILFVGPWTAAISGTINSQWVIENKQFISFLPLIVSFIFGIYAATIVLYRTFTFNNCEEAAQQLQRQIAEAQAELRIFGILQRDPMNSELK